MPGASLSCCALRRPNHNRVGVLAGAPRRAVLAVVWRAGAGRSARGGVQQAAPQRLLRARQVKALAVTPTVTDCASSLRSPRLETETTKRSSWPGVAFFPELAKQKFVDVAEGQSAKFMDRARLSSRARPGAEPDSGWRGAAIKVQNRRGAAHTSRPGRVQRHDRGGAEQFSVLQRNPSTPRPRVPARPRSRRRKRADRRPSSVGLRVQPARRAPRPPPAAAMVVTAADLETDSAGAERPFAGALKNGRTGRWFQDPAAQGIHADVFGDGDDAMMPPVEEFLAFVDAGPYKGVFAQLATAPAPKRQATGDLQPADAEQIGAAARQVVGAAGGLAAEAGQVAALGGPETYGQLDRECKARTSFRGGKCCASGDCVRRLWFSQNEDAWKAHGACRAAAQPADQVVERAAPSSAAVKTSVVKGFESTVGGYTDGRMQQGGGGGDSEKEARQGEKRWKLEVAEVERSAEQQRVVAKEEHATTLAKLKQAPAPAAADASGEPPPERWLMCMNAALFFVDEAPHCTRGAGSPSARAARG